MEMFSLKNKVAVISGGAGLYGKQLVRALAMGGAKVYMASRNIEKNKEVADKLCKEGYDVTAAYLDLSDEESIIKLKNDIVCQ